MQQPLTICSTLAVEWTFTHLRSTGFRSMTIQIPHKHCFRDKHAFFPRMKNYRVTLEVSGAIQQFLGLWKIHEDPILFSPSFLRFSFFPQLRDVARALFQVLNVCFQHPQTPWTCSFCCFPCLLYVLRSLRHTRRRGTRKRHDLRARRSSTAARRPRRHGPQFGRGQRPRRSGAAAPRGQGRRRGGVRERCGALERGGAPWEGERAEEPAAVEWSKDAKIGIERVSSEQKETNECNNH